MSDLPVAPDSLGTLGKSYELIEKGIKIKPYPCGGLTHSAIGAVLEMRSRHGIGAEMVESIDTDVTRHTYDRIAFKIPATGLQGKFSMGYLLARAMIDGRISLDAFTDAAVRDQRVLELAEKVHMRLDPSLRESRDGGRPCTVTIRLKNGKSFSERVEHPKGSRGVPLSPQELRGKFIECATRAISDKAAERVLEYLDRLENLPDVRPLCQMLSGAA